MFNATLWQIVSADDGKTWSSPVDLSDHIKACNPDVKDTQVQSAGSKLQSPTGRLIWAGHDHSSNVCVWYSDDGGASYQTAPRFEGNEISIAVADTAGCTAGKCQLYMNGRGGKRFGPHRTDYYSTDNGASWTGGSRSALMEDASGGCEEP